MKVLILKGLPGSGKSTYAKQLQKEGNWKRVNKDDLRAMLDNSRWSKKNERFVIDLRNYIIVQALDLSYNVVVDDTNFAPQHEQDIRNLIMSSSNGRVATAEIKVKFMDTPLEECIKRDLYRPNSVGKDVIMKMYNQYVNAKIEAIENPSVVYMPPKDAPKALIVDIDGTLAHMVDRGPFEFNKVHQDRLDEIVAHVVQTYHDLGYKIIICSGRDDDPVCKRVTEEWLKQHNVPYDKIFMRDRTRVDAKGGKVHDNIIKREIFDKYIKDNYNIQFVLDDRNQVVDMWRNELGLKVLQVANGDF